MPIILYIVLLALTTVLSILLIKTYKKIKILKKTNEDNLHKLEYYKTQLIIRYNNTADPDFELGAPNER